MGLFGGLFENHSSSSANTSNTTNQYDQRQVDTANGNGALVAQSGSTFTINATSTDVSKPVTDMAGQAVGDALGLSWGALDKSIGMAGTTTSQSLGLTSNAVGQSLGIANSAVDQSVSLARQIAATLGASVGQVGASLGQFGTSATGSIDGLAHLMDQQQGSINKQSTSSQQMTMIALAVVGLVAVMAIRRH